MKTRTPKPLKKTLQLHVAVDCIRIAYFNGGEAVRPGLLLAAAALAAQCSFPYFLLEETRKATDAFVRGESPINPFAPPPAA